MAISYAYKRVLRSWRLFLALLLGVVLASAFFAGINIGADSMARRALEQQLATTPVDLELTYYGGSESKSSIATSNNYTATASLASGVEGVSSVEVNPTIYVDAKASGIEENLQFICAGLFDNSRAYNGITGWTKKPGINETLMASDSRYASMLHIGDHITFNLTIWTYSGRNSTMFNFPVNLTVVGFVTLTDEAYAISTGSSSGILYSPSSYGVPGIGVDNTVRSGSNLCLVGWNTLSKLIDSVNKISTYSIPFQVRVSVFLDRESLVDPWDITKSLDIIGRVDAKIGNTVAAQGFGLSYDRISSTLRNYQNTANSIRFSSIVTSLPIFFVAWYMASTVSNVSFNLRRREIGLLLSKGSTKGQLLSIFLGEAALIGSLGGIIGVGLSYVLSPLFVQLVGGIFGSQVVLGVETILITTIFGVAITLVAIFQPARKASKLNPVDAMREYTYVEEVKPYKKLLPMAALFLGTFKVATLLLGINFQQVAMNVGGSGNIFVMIVLSVLVFLDGVLTYIGPLLFFWGVIKVFIQGSVIFQGLSTRLMKGFLGDLGSLATRNVQRNPGRTASIAFLIALIIGYTISVNGALASEQDYTRRQIYFNVGCLDASIAMPISANVSQSIARVDNISGVSSVTMEYGFSGDSTGGALTLKAVNASVWPDLGYCEDEWFTGENARNAFQTLAGNNRTIILDRTFAKYLDLQIGDTVALTFGQDGSKYNLRIVGYFGSEQLPQQYYPKPIPESSAVYAPQYYWSFVSQELYMEVKDRVQATPRMLVKLKPQIDRKGVVEQIRNLDPPIGWVQFVDETLENQQASAELSGVTNIQRLGITFAVLAASIGTSLVTIVGLSERKKEISLINVRGASYKQLIITLLAEGFSVVVFAILLGSAVGFIILRGNVSSANAFVYSLVKRRIFFTGEFLMMLVSGYLLIFASLILPIFLASRRYMSKLGDVIRQK